MMPNHSLCKAIDYHASNVVALENVEALHLV
jgi:hypothetical protein